jgi:hypothetical protein
MALTGSNRAEGENYTSWDEKAIEMSKRDVLPPIQLLRQLHIADCIPMSSPYWLLLPPSQLLGEHSLKHSTMDVHLEATSI